MNSFAPLEVNALSTQSFIGFCANTIQQEYDLVKARVSHKKQGLT